MTKELVKKQSIGNFLNFPETNKFLEETLKDKKGEFVSNILALVDSDSKLAECDPKDLMMCCINATALNLPLNKNLGYAYVIPYKNNKLKKYEPQFQIGTKGYKQLAIRTNAYKTINHCEIREDELSYDKFTGEFVFHKENPNGKIVAYFAFFELLSGYKKSFKMTIEQIEAHAIKYSSLYRADRKNKTKYSKWSTDERHEMSLKTVIKLLLSREGLLSTDMTKAFTVDTENETSKHSNRNIQDVEIIPQDEPENKVKTVEV